MNNSHRIIPYYFSRAQALSLVVALVMAAVSLTGLLLPANLYPTEELRHAFLANDVVNLLIGLPALLGALWFLRRANLLGLLGLPGALFYVTYNSIAYATAMPLTWPFFVHLGLAILSAVAIFLHVSSVDGAAVQAQLQGRVAERFGSVVLMGFGILFFLRAAAEFFDGAVGMAEFGVMLADGLTTPFWILGGLALWRKQPLGYVCGAGLLFQASMLFIGLLVFFILQPFVTGIPFPLEDFIVILVMGLVVFVPFGLFLRGIRKAAS